MDVVFLSRLQFALTIMFHYIFPPLTIGLSLVVVYLLALRLKTGDAIYDTAARFWTKIFGINFAVGVATGIVMEFQFGTNWAVYSRYVGDVFGSALAAEGIFAFFLESGFLAVLLFGWDRVSAKFHFFAATMVSLGSIFSSVWITVANSWQQTPAGFVLREQTVNQRTVWRAEITDFWAMVFNPSSMHRLVHVWFGAFILGAFFVMSIAAWYLLHGRHAEFARRSFSGALVLATIFSLAQLVSGHFQAGNVGEHQPAKLAAFEGLYTTEPATGMYLWGWPSDEAGKVALRRRGAGPPRLPGAGRRERQRARLRPARGGLGQAPGVDQLPVVPLDGDARRPVHRRHPLRLLPALARHAVRAALAAVVLRLRGARRLRRQPARLGGRRGRPPAVDRLPDGGGGRHGDRRSEDRRRRLRGGDQRPGAGIDPDVRLHLPAALRPLGHRAQPQDPGGTGAARRGDRRDRPDARCWRPARAAWATKTR